MIFDLQHKTFLHPDDFADKLAVAGSDQTLSWAALKSETEKLHALLSSLQLPKGHPVMIYGHKQAHYLVAICALMQLDLPYVPTDIIFPVSRIKAMQQVCRSQVLICLEAAPELESGFEVVIHLPEMKVQNKNAVSHLPEYPVSSDATVSYILFTSGSTGIPKGVPILHPGVADFGRWIADDFGLTEQDVILNLSALSFDFASFEEFALFQLGCSLVLTAADVIKDSDRLLQLMLDRGVTTWVSTPGLVYRYLLEPRFNTEYLPLLKHFVFAGEALPVRTVQKLHQLFPDAEIINAYGPTEATNLTCKCVLTPEILQQYQAVPIGQPKPNAHLFLDQADQDGIGELIIAGDHVTPGYLYNEALNAEKFFVHEGKRAYRSGDLAFLKDGLFFYAGRNDDMVKWHGYRIELEDISSKLLQHEGVKQAVCIPLKAGQETKKIIAFVVLHETDSVSKQALFDFLTAELPVYMLPSDIRFIEAVPLNASDKTDVKRLLEIALS